MKKNNENKQLNNEALATLSTYENELKELGVTTNVIHVINNIKERKTAESNHVNMALSCVSVLAEKNEKELNKIIEENNFDRLISVITKTIAHIESAT